MKIKERKYKENRYIITQWLLIPINRAFYIDHFSFYIIVFSFEKKGKNYKFGKN